MKHANILAILLIFLLSLSATGTFGATQRIKTGAEHTEAYLPMLEGKRVGLVVNQTAVVQRVTDGVYVPLPDTLLALGVNVRCIMAPEHGYRGTAEAGAHITNGKDEATGLQIYSLYGNTKKPQAAWLKEIDVVVFDIQDVGCRFYTYLSTLYYVMQACGEQHKELIILDRPNPKDVVDGPTLDMKYASFVGIIPIPLLHGCTLGELARIMAEMGWLNEQQQPGMAEPEDRFTIIPCSGWKHGDPYSLPIGPSKNLQNDHAIALYPSLCLFEGSEVSVGRGTDHPFEMFGKHDLRKEQAPEGFSLKYYLQHQKEMGWGWITRAKFFNQLAGSDKLYNQLKAGMTEEQIRATWQEDLERFKAIRKQFAIYPLNASYLVSSEHGVESLELEHKR